MDELRKLKAIVKYAIDNPYSSFYKKKYAKAGIGKPDIKTWEDFQKLPFLTREEILGTEPYKRIFIASEKLVGVLATSGSLNQGRLIMVQERPMVRADGILVGSPWRHIYPRTIKLGINKIMILTTILGVNRNFLYPPPSKLLIVYADISDLNMAAEIAFKVGIEGVVTTPSALYFFIPYLEKCYDLNRIKEITLSGEYCSLEKFKLFRRFFPKATIRSDYGSSEARDLGWQCDFLANNKNPSIYHFSEEVYPEVIDPVTFENLTEGKEGELVITAFGKRAFIPIRYRFGDIVKILTKKCGCGSTMALFESLGRQGTDYISISGARLVKTEFEKALLKFGNISSDFKARIRERSLGQAIVYDVEVLVPVLDKRLLGKQAFGERLGRELQLKIKVSPTLTYADLVKKGIFTPLKIKLVEKLPFEVKRKSFEMK